MPIGLPFHNYLILGTNRKFAELNKTVNSTKKFLKNDNTNQNIIQSYFLTFHRKSNR